MNAPIVIDRFIDQALLGYSRDLTLAYWADRVVIGGEYKVFYVTTNDHGDEVARSFEKPEIDIPSEAA